ncbi:MAG: porin family protein [Alphaproteobacteria bacterium]|nr:porin family protein [Alphaproteobacteria bacterium]
MRVIGAALAAVLLALPASADWSGFYIGGSAGAGWRGSELGFVPPSTPAGPFATDAQGITYGAHIGGAYQMGPWVLGLEASLRGGDLDSASSCDVGNSDVCSVEVDHLTVVMARAGWAAGDLLFSVSGGYAEAAFDLARRVSPATLNPNPSFGSFDHKGFEAGAAVEKRLTDNFALGIEYQHIGLRDDEARIVRVGDGAFAQLRHETDLDFVKVRASFLF